MDTFTFILDIDPRNVDEHPNGNFLILTQGKLVLNVEPVDLTILLVCFVGVNNCTEQSTGISSIGDQTTSATPSTPSVMHTTGATSEVTSAGKHGRLDTLCLYGNTLEIQHNPFRYGMVRLMVW